MPTKIQLIAFEIDTHSPDKLNSILAARGANPLEMTEAEYFTLQANIQRDHIKRHVMPLLAEDTLSVFMAPEFYFKHATGLPYSRQTFFNQMEFMIAISKSFPRVLWVAGSVWWSEPAANPGQVTVHNTVPIYYGGRMVHTWQKNRLSNLDGLQQGPQLWDRWDEAGARVLAESQDSSFTIPHHDASVSLGIEVCLDHRTIAANPPAIPAVLPGVLRSTYLEKSGNAGAGLDLHLLVAAGMSMQDENVVARHGGVILRCDGGAGAVRSQARQVVRAGGNTPEALRAWSPTYHDAAPALPIGPDADNRIVIYPAITLS